MPLKQLLAIHMILSHHGLVRNLESKSQCHSEIALSGLGRDPSPTRVDCIANAEIANQHITDLKLVLLPIRRVHNGAHLILSECFFRSPQQPLSGRHQPPRLRSQPALHVFRSQPRPTGGSTPFQATSRNWSRVAPDLKDTQ